MRMVVELSIGLRAVYVGACVFACVRVQKKAKLSKKILDQQTMNMEAPKDTSCPTTRFTHRRTNFKRFLLDLPPHDISRI